MRLFHTAHVPAGDGPFPTLILIHGWGANGHDLLGLAPYLHDGRALVLCPQGKVELPIGPGQVGYGWFHLTPGQPPEPEEFRERSAELREWVEEACDRYPIDRMKLVIGGFSQGGAMAFDLALRDPARYAGLAALSTWFAEPLAAAIPKLPEHERLPTLMIHGTRDVVIEVERARASRERLRTFDVALQYREVEMGHEINAETLRTFDRWLKEKAFV